MYVITRLLSNSCDFRNKTVVMRYRILLKNIIYMPKDLLNENQSDTK